MKPEPQSIVDANGLLAVSGEVLISDIDALRVSPNNYAIPRAAVTNAVASAELLHLLHLNSSR